MNIGIVTTYDEINFGAFLQAYSLQKYLENIGHTASLINYKGFRYRLRELKSTYVKKDPIFFFKTLLKGYKFHISLKEMNITKRFKSLRAINNANFDLIIFGSDEIWNVNNCLGISDDYYFGKDIRTRKIAYAPSFGSTNKLDNNKSYLINMIRDFESISMRDENSIKILKANNFKNLVLTLDPTFLIKQKYKKPVIKEKYLFYYCIGASKELDYEVSNFAKLNGLEVISFGYKNKRFRNIVGIDPFEWLGYLKEADYVVTNMYHGTIFSLKFNKKFVLELSEYRMNKLSTLVKLFDIHERIYKTQFFQKNMLNEIDYSFINQKISSLTQESKEFLYYSI